jgi:septum formation protein
MQNPSAPEILLASSSPYRRGLLDRFLVEFEAVSPDVDESNTEGLEPADLARHLARAKAEAVSASTRNALVIGADQLAVLDGHVLGKPGSHQKAVEQLLAASGKSVKFLETVVHFREFDRRLAEAYLRLDEPYDCAGSFKLEGAGFLLFESVKTDDPTALIGLPMIWISDRLLELGYLLP